MGRNCFIPPFQAEQIMNSYFGIFSDGSPVYPKYPEYTRLRANGASLFSRKTLTASAAPTQQKFFNGAPGSYTGNYKSDGVLGDFFAVILGIRIKAMIHALTTPIEIQDMMAGGFVTIKQGDTKEVWTKVPLHEVIDGPHMQSMSNITAAATEAVYLPGGAAEQSHDAFLLYQPDEKFEVILDWDVSIYASVVIATVLDCVIDYVAKTKG